MTFIWNLLKSYQNSRRKNVFFLNTVYIRWLKLSMAVEEEKKVFWFLYTSDLLENALAGLTGLSGLLLVGTCDLVLELVGDSELGWTVGLGVTGWLTGVTGWLTCILSSFSSSVWLCVAASASTSSSVWLVTSGCWAVWLFVVSTEEGGCWW